MNGFGLQGWLNPWQRLREVEREMNRLFSEVAGGRPVAFPPVNVYTDEDSAVVTAELPGVDAASLDIAVHDRTLVLRGERKAPQTDSNDRWLRQERVLGTFARSIDLPFAVDAEKVEATCRDGVLEMRLHRRESDKPRKIMVQG